MNFIKKISGILAAATILLAASCQKGELAYPEMCTDKAVYEIAEGGGTAIVKLKATRDWTATISPATSLDNIDGIVVSPEAGKASAEFVEVTVTAHKNESYPRSVIISFVSENVSVAVTVNQRGVLEREPQKLTVKEFLDKAVDAGIWYEMTGKIENLSSTVYGNFNLVDETGSVYVYGLTKEKVGSNDKSFSSIGLKEGDIVTLKGTRSAYNGSPQVGGPAYYVSHVEGEVDPTLPVKATAAEINAAEDGPTKYELTGYVSSIANKQYGNLYIKDATGQVYVYGINDWANKTISEGDIVTVVSAKTTYKESSQLKNADVTGHKVVAEKTVLDFIAAAEIKDVYYRLTGTVSNLKDDDQYGNFDLTDATGSIYVYGLLSGWGGPKKEFQNLGLKNGDVVTIVGVRTSYNGKNQVGNAFYVSHQTPVGQ